MTKRTIPFSPPDIQESDIQAVVDVLRSGWITTGPVSAEFEEALAEFTGASGVVATSSATTALESILRLMGVGPGDEVVVPAYTYTASASSIIHVGATPVLIDNAPGQFTPGIDEFSAALTPRTKAVLPVDLAGIPYPTAELTSLVSGLDDFKPSSPLQEAFGRPVVIVDSAHSLGATRDGFAADFRAYSFHAVKNLTTAEGGALAWDGVPGDNDDDIKAQIRRSILHGQNKDALAKSRGNSWEYDILEPAYKANLPDVLSALGLSQLKRYPSMIARRHELLDIYSKGLSETQLNLLAHSDEGWRSSAHLAIAYLPEPDIKLRNQLIEDLFDAGVSANVHYKPLPLMTAYSSLGFDSSGYPNAVSAYESEITLPLHTRLSNDDVSFICDVIAKSLG